MRGLDRYSLVFASLVGLFLGLYLYGVKRVDPTFVDWMMGGDAATYYLSWQFLRAEPWSYPLGLINNYTYPFATSIVFADAVPIVAIFLKLFDSVLPANFQYHGALVLINFMLQGLFACLLVRQFTDKFPEQIIGVCFFLLMPVFILRSWGHVPISFHWIILGSIYFYVIQHSRNKVFLWSLLLIFSSGINFYIFTMAFSIYAFYLIKMFLVDKSRRYFFLVGWPLTTLAMSYIVMHAIGYFVIGVEGAQSGNFGFYSMNLLSYFSPTMRGEIDFFPSVFINSYKPAILGQYEGYNYPGAGILFLVVSGFVIWALITKLHISMKYLPLLGLMLILTIFAISNTIVWGDRVLFRIPIPDILYEKLTTFRSSGRFFWIVSYLLLLFSYVAVVKKLSRFFSITLLSIALTIQVIDLYPNLTKINHQFWNRLANYQWQTPLKSEDWDKLLSQYKHIAFMPAKRHHNNYVPFALYAVNNGKTFNVGYVARGQDRNPNSRAETQAFFNGEYKPDTLYILPDLQISDAIKYDDSVTSGLLDNYLVVAPEFKEPGSLTDLQRENYLRLDDIFTLSQNKIIIISVRDEATRKLPKSFIDLASQRGSQISTLTYRGSYGAIFDGDKLVNEQLAENKSTNFRHLLDSYSIDVISGGKNTGNLSKIVINDVDYSKNKRGLNIVTIDKETREILSYSFDTHLGYTLVSAGQKFTLH